MARTPTTPGTHIEYSIDRVNQTDAVEFVAAHGSRVAALEAAVEAGHKVVFAKYGEHLPEAIARVATEKATGAPRTPAARPVADRPQA